MNGGGRKRKFHQSMLSLVEKIWDDEKVKKHHHGSHKHSQPNLEKENLTFPTLSVSLRDTYSSYSPIILTSWNLPPQMNIHQLVN